MVISLLIYLLISNAVNLRRDKSVLLSRIVITSLFFTSFTSINNSLIKDHLYINPYITIILTITLFSSTGITCLIGFFAKQMGLSAALDNGCVFIVSVAMLTSVICAACYLNLIKLMFSYKHNYQKNSSLANVNLVGYITSTLAKLSKRDKTVTFTSQNIKISSSPTDHISVITLVLLLFIYLAPEWFNIVSILSVIQFNS